MGGKSCRCAERYHLNVTRGSQWSDACVTPLSLHWEFPMNRGCICQGSWGFTSCIRPTLREKPTGPLREVPKQLLGSIIIWRMSSCVKANFVVCELTDRHCDIDKPANHVTYGRRLLTWLIAETYDRPSALNTSTSTYTAAQKNYRSVTLPSISNQAWSRLPCS